MQRCWWSCWWKPSVSGYFTHKEEICFFTIRHRTIAGRKRYRSCPPVHLVLCQQSLELLKWEWRTPNTCIVWCIVWKVRDMFHPENSVSRWLITQFMSSEQHKPLREHGKKKTKKKTTKLKSWCRETDPVVWVVCVFCVCCCCDRCRAWKQRWLSIQRCHPPSLRGRKTPENMWNENTFGTRRCSPTKKAHGIETAMCVASG